jgi:lipid-A-disaccharide synthase
MRYYIIAGEASGDLHGSNLMREIKLLDSAADFRFWGGDKMSAEGGQLVKHYKNHDYMGVVQVAKNLRKILGNIKYCKADITAHKPDAIIFIDFPGFNLRLIKHCKELGIQTFYYISPTVWAWKESRAISIKKYVDHMFVVLPFVKDFYARRHNYKVDFVGHPLMDSILAHTQCPSLAEFQAANGIPELPLVAVLPGSRKSEIEENLAAMQAIAPHFRDHQFVVAGMSNFNMEFYAQRIAEPNVSIVFDQTYSLLKLARAAIVVSGSATLETAIIGCPEMLVFKTSFISYRLAKLVLKLPFLALPNLIAGEKIIEEFIQYDMTPDNLRKDLNRLLYDEGARAKIQEGYETMRAKLGQPGASGRVAGLIREYMQKGSSNATYAPER